MPSSINLLKIKNSKLLILLILVFIKANAQDLTATQILEKSINYHDPNHNWESFNDSLYIELITPNEPIRKSKIKIDLKSESFYLQMVKDSDTVVYALNKEHCNLQFQGSKKNNYELSCERANMYKNYYTYLYGLPMKLKDKGTIIHKEVKRKTLNDKVYLVIKVSYQNEVGKDIWYFYFNPSTYAMEAYQFFKNESKNDGEYILLSGIEMISDIKLPKQRKWFTNKNDSYLGVDILKTNP